MVAWGGPGSGGDSTSVADRLSWGVISIYSTPHAFAALKEGGAVVTWGDYLLGGDSHAVASWLESGVRSIRGTQTGGASSGAFAALKYLPC